MLFTFLLIVHALIAALLVAVILMQKSEGGGLGMGGSPTGLMSARGAADFLTRATTVLASAFVVMSILLAALASYTRGPRTLDTSLARPASSSQTPTSDVPLAGDPLAPASAAVSTNPGPVTPEAPAGETIPQVRPAPATATVSPGTTAPAARAAPAPSEHKSTVPATTSAGKTSLPGATSDHKPAASAPATGTPSAAAGKPAPTPAAIAPAPKATTPPATSAPSSTSVPFVNAPPAPIQEKTPAPASGNSAAGG